MNVNISFTAFAYDKDNKCKCKDPACDKHKIKWRLGTPPLNTTNVLVVFNANIAFDPSTGGLTYKPVVSIINKDAYHTSKEAENCALLVVEQVIIEFCNNTKEMFKKARGN